MIRDAAFFGLSLVPRAVLGDETEFRLLENEYWWGANAGRGYKMPFSSKTDISFHMGDNPEGSDQYAPLLLSSKGRYVWSEKPFITTFRPPREY